MATRDEDTVTVEVLPPAEQGDRVRERPNNLLRGHAVKLLKLPAKVTVGWRHVGQKSPPPPPPKSPPPPPKSPPPPPVSPPPKKPPPPRSPPASPPASPPPKS